MDKPKTVDDPFAQREAEKYEKPIPSREFILQYLTECGRPVARKKLIQDLGLETEEQYEALRRRLRAMERDGQLISNRRGAYGIVDKMNLICGRVVGHKDGFGFVVPDDAGGDLFLSAREMRALFDGDRVLVRVAGVDRRGRREGAVAEILERNTLSVVGRFFVEGGVGFVVPDNKRLSQNILIPPEEWGAAHPGQIVIAEIVIQPSHWRQATGRISEILGDHMAPGMEIDVALRAHDIPHTWPEEVAKETAHLDTKVPDKVAPSRIDLRDLPFVTIDGEDAKDFDDAVFCKKRPRGGWCLYVAIADVSHYVQPNTALDEEAFRRSTSVYFPGQVIPMLPEILSNELCSLKQKIDRLCMVCEAVVSSAGKITSYRFYEAVMHSKARLTYNEVAAMLFQDNKTLRKRHAELLPHLEELERLYKTLHTSREKRGAIDFETIETRVIFGSGRKIEQIVPVERNEAHKIIEECMLAANVAAANFLVEHDMPVLFRVHEGPSPEKLVDLRSFLAELGLGLRGGERPQPRHYAELLQTVNNRPDAHLIRTVLLRSLSQAVYSPRNTGHFGLAYEAYTHFTSPIRRYPDLLVHRAIRHVLTGQPADKFYYDKNKMVSLGEHCSVAERRADEAVRDAMDWLKCEFMLERVGQEFEGIVTGVTGFGLFVMLQNIYTEGLLHVTALKNDYYTFDPARHRLRGERTGATYRLGDHIRVKVVRVNLEEKQIDFELADSKQGKRPARKRQ